MSVAECLRWTSQHPMPLLQEHPANDNASVQQPPHPSHHPRRAKRGSRDEGGAKLAQAAGRASFGGGLTHQSVEQTYSYAQRPHAPINLSERTPNENTNYDREVTYDESGNQTGWTFRGQNRAIEWNEDDQIKRITKNGQELNRTLYDAQGQKAVHLHYVSGMEETAYLGPNLTIRDGKYLTKHVYVGDQRVSSKMDPDWFQYPPTLYFHPDHLGSTQYASNDEQTLIQHDEFFPSGEPWRDETDSRYELARRFVFTGKELDIHTGLYDYGARSYDARMGVWLSPDPILDQYMEGKPNRGAYWSANLMSYQYAGNNPVKMKDENGEEIVLVGTSAEVNQTLGALQSLTADRLGIRRTGSNSYQVIILKTNNNAGKERGTQLVRRMRHSARTATVTHSTGGSQETDANSTAATNGTGSDATVEWNPGQNPYVTESDGVSRAMDSDIVLGHELIHADRSMRGEASVYPPGGMARCSSSPSTCSVNTYKDASGTSHSQTVPNEELETVGIRPSPAVDITENDLRRERGQRARESY